MYLLIASILFALLIYSGFKYFSYESPEKCFAREMAEWGESHPELAKVINKLITQKDAKMMVAVAKTTTDTYSIKDANEENGTILLVLKTRLEYCKIK